MVKDRSLETQVLLSVKESAAAVGATGEINLEGTEKGK